MKQPNDFDEDACPECGGHDMLDHYFYVECALCGHVIEHEVDDEDLDENFAERLEAACNEVSRVNYRKPG